MAARPRFGWTNLSVRSPAPQSCSQWFLRSMRIDVSSTCNTGMASRRSTAAASQSASASWRRRIQASRVASETSRPVRTWMVWAARFSETICETSSCVAKATMPSP